MATSFKSTMLIPNEQHDTLRKSLMQLVASLKHVEGCTVKVDTAPGFLTLRDDKILKSAGIGIDFGRVKNKNHNPTIDKAI